MDDRYTQNRQLLKQFPRGTSVFAEFGKDGWMEAAVTQSGSTLVTVKTKAGKETTIHMNKLVLEQPQSLNVDLAEVEDLCVLSPLSASTVLQCLEERYTHQLYYTRAGSTLVALNPFTSINGLYGDEAIQRTRDPTSQSGPHVYAVAEKAYQNLRMVVENSKVNQCIIVSGESGAGKTVSGRHLMNYLVTVSSHRPHSLHTLSTNPSPVALDIEEKILDSNPILEAFGNASTLRNHNSSRFGKYIELHFDLATEHIVGASIKTYLLEKTRVVSQAPKEHNFHVFYQLLHGKYTSLLNGVLKDDVFTAFDIANCSGRDTDVDRSDLIGLERALTNIGVSPAQKTQIFKVLVGILLLGNLKFVSEDGESSSDRCCVDKEQNDILEMACEILGLPSSDLEVTLTHKKITASHARRQSVFHKPCKASEAANRRDCMAKVLYDRLFTWVVDFINYHIKGEQDSSQTADIGILDIYGFESFDKNSLEQLCINYANEKLQQHFVVHFLRDLQEDYAKEGIPWNFTDFVDNHRCVELLEQNPGVFALLDEECSLNRKSKPAALAERIVDTIRERHMGLDDMRDPRVPGFAVRHYAGKVHYSTEEIVQKNQDNIASDLVHLLTRSSSVFVTTLLGEMEVDRPGKRRKTVLSKFKSSLKILMDTLERCQPHYIRCIKPNTYSRPSFCDRLHILRQLEACGVVATVKICKQAYPARMSYRHFVKHYGLILHHTEIPAHVVHNNNHHCSSKAVHCGLPDSPLVINQYGPEAEVDAITIQGDARAVMEYPPEIIEDGRRKFNKRRKGVPGSDHTRILCGAILKTVFPTLYTDSPAESAQFGRTKVFLMDGQLEKLESVRQFCLSRCAFTIQCAWYRYKSRRRQRRNQATRKLQAVIRGWLHRRQMEQKKMATIVLQRFARRHLIRHTPKTASPVPNRVSSVDPDKLEHNIVIAADSLRNHRSVKSNKDSVLPVKTEEEECAIDEDIMTEDQSDTNNCVQKSLCTHTEYPIELLQCTHIEDNLVCLYGNLQEDTMSQRKSILYPMYPESDDSSMSPSVQKSCDYRKVISEKIETFQSLIERVCHVVRMEQQQQGHRKRFQMVGLFWGIPYMEAQDGVFSRRRMPRVKMRFHTRANPILPGGHFISQRELQCSLVDCL